MPKDKKPAKNKSGRRTTRDASQRVKTARGRTASSQRWLERQLNDPYVREAQRQGYRSRAAFKLKEIDETDRLIGPGSVIVDLGAAPGSWSQYARERLKGRAGGGIDGLIVALDLLPMAPIAEVDFILGDFRDEAVLAQLEAKLADRSRAAPDGRCVDLVLSDMAPNLSGVEVADAARMADVIELAADFALRFLKPRGALLVKAFHGSGYSQIVESLKRDFVTVAPRKPKASRDRSSETFILARGLKRP
jgi:23S rRNA (uridine2552-2'-O)-methyltransferase